MSDGDVPVEPVEPPELVEVPCGVEWVQLVSGTTYTCVWPTLCADCEAAYNVASDDERYRISHPPIQSRDDG